MKPRLNDVQNDMGCIFHPGGHAPDQPGQYTLDAWIAAPAGASAPAMRRICDACVRKIQHGEEGLWQHFAYDQSNQEVRPICAGGDS